MSKEFFSIDFKDNKLIFIDQNKLPLVEDYIETDDYEIIAKAIERLAIRGAPAIGIAAAYALALSLKFKSSEEIFFIAYERLKQTRPTAVNLFKGLNLIKSRYESLTENEKKEAYTILIQEAKNFHIKDIESCENIAKNGIKIFDANKKYVVLTHCNTGALATAGIGTALGIIKRAYEYGLIELVYVDETRPLFQGSRLTAFELEKCGIPFEIITDSTAAYLMKKKLVDLALVGADRIAANGDVANKIGTYNLAVVCKYHQIPLYVAAPETTIDYYAKSENDFIIEIRLSKEITEIKGLPISKSVYPAFAPAFDSTSSSLIDGIITDKNLYFYPYNFNE